MSSKQSSTEEVSVDAQAFEQANAGTVADDGFPVVDETPELRPTVEQETQAKVDANHPEGITEEGPDHLYGQTLADEERIRAREEELMRISARGHMSKQVDREARSRRIASERCSRLDATHADREDRRGDDRVDPRERLTREELASVNRTAMDVAQRVTGSDTRAELGRKVAERVEADQDARAAALDLVDGPGARPRGVIPIDGVAERASDDVTLQGEVRDLWEPSHPAIQQVGLLADDTGTIKFTIWCKSGLRTVREGEEVRLERTKRSWYQGRCSVALTSASMVIPVERDRWWQA